MRLYRAWRRKHLLSSSEVKIYIAFLRKLKLLGLIYFLLSKLEINQIFIMKRFFKFHLSWLSKIHNNRVYRASWNVWLVSLLLQEYYSWIEEKYSLYLLYSQKMIIFSKYFSRIWKLFQKKNTHWILRSLSWKPRNLSLIDWKTPISNRTYRRTV